MRAVSALALTLAVSFMAACADEEKTTPAEACPAYKGDVHLAQGESTPDGVPVMLHVVGRQCAGLGENRFQVLPYDPDSHEAPAFVGAHEHMNPGDMGSVELTKAEFHKKADGAVGADAVAIDADDASYVAASFPQTGTWVAKFSFMADAATTAPQSIELLLDVK